ncbi:MAG: histidine--tRNA ligase [Candidatus Woesearchaeota archaeon]|nr:histidine--tRNA ligase [Candidatus Woesearchaeota archaeon]
MYQKPKGTEDYFPEEKEVFNRIADSLRYTCKSYGYKEISSPAFESIGLLTAKQGPEIKSQIFLLERKGGVNEKNEEKEEYGLRFDLTVPMARMFIEKQKELPKPVKWFSISRMWRYERPQQGRQREFYQLSVECFGSDKPEADAEIICMVIDCLRNLGLTKKDFVVKINNRALLQDFVQSIGATDYEAVFRAIDKKQKIPGDVFDKELKNAGLNYDQIKKIKEFIGIKDIDKIKIKSAGLENLKKVLALLEKKKEFIEIDLSTARGLAYYTGIVFEIFDKQGKLRSIAGGGRYDNLISLLGGDKCPATGFAIGFATLSLLLKEKKLLPKISFSVDYYIAPIGEKALEKAFEIAEKLRKNAVVEMDIMGRSLAKQLEYANKINAKNVVIIGDDELKKKEVKIKDMNTGKEKIIKIDSL